MKIKKAVKTSICFLLVLLLLLPTQLSVLAGTETTSSTNSEISEDDIIKKAKDWAEDTLDNSKTSEASTMQPNRILGEASFAARKATVTYHADQQNEYTPADYPNAAATIEVSLFVENADNADAMQNGTEFAGLIAEGTAEGVALTDSSASRDMDLFLADGVGSIPQYFYIETIYTLYVDGKAVLTEKQRSSGYTKAYEDLHNATLSDILLDGSSTEYTADYIENFDSASAGNSKQFAVFKSEAQVVKAEQTYTVTVNNNEYTLDKVPTELASKTADDLKKIPELIFIGTVTTDANEVLQTISTDGTKTEAEKYPVPLAEDSDGNYKLEFVYGNGTGQAATGIKFTVNESADIEDVYDYLKFSEEGTSSNETKTVDKEYVKGTVTQNMSINRCVEYGKWLKLQYVSVGASICSEYKLTFSGTVAEESIYFGSIREDTRTFPYSGNSTFKISGIGHGTIEGTFTTECVAKHERNTSPNLEIIVYAGCTTLEPENQHSSLNCILGCAFDATAMVRTKVFKTIQAQFDSSGTGVVSYIGKYADEPSGVEYHKCVEEGKAGCISVEEAKTSVGWISWKCFDESGRKEIYPTVTQKNYYQSKTFGDTYLKEGTCPRYGKKDELLCVYDANGGTNAPHFQSYPVNGTLTIRSERPVREDYEFVGWAESSTATKAAYMPGQQCRPGKDLMLYAVWKYVGHKQLLKITGGKTADKQTETYVLVGDRATVTADDAPEGMSFAYWKVNSGSLKLTDKQKSESTMTFTMPASDVELEAVFMDTPVTPFAASVKYGTLNGERGATVFYAGTEVTAAASVAGSLKFDHWNVTGLSLTETELHSEVMTFTMPENAITLEAVYAAAPRSSYSLETENGTIAGAGDDGHKKDVTPDTRVTVQAADKPEDVDASSNIIEYYFQRWVVVSGNLNLTEEQAASKRMTFIMPNDDVVLVAEFKTIYKTPQLQMVRGSITSGTYKGKTHGQFDADTVVEVMARTGGSLVFSHWNAIGIELTEEQKTSEKMKIKMPDNDVILTAVYKSSVIEPHDVTVVKGYITGKSGTSTESYVEGATVSVTPSIGGGLTFDHWFAAGITLTETESKQNPLVFNMPDNDVKLVAMYNSSPSAQQELYVVCGKVKNSNTQSNGVDTGYYTVGTDVTVEADFAAGMVFDHWESDGIQLTEKQKTSATMTFTMPDNVAALAAVYKPSGIEPHSLLMDYGVIVEGDKEYVQGTYYEGSRILVRANYLDGVKFDHWEANGITLTDEEKTEPELLVTMPDNNVQLKAVFTSTRMRAHVIKTVNATFNNGKTEWDYYPGTEVEATADAITGMRFVKWKVTKGELELTDEQIKTKTITFSMPDEDIELTAVFEKAPETGDLNDHLFMYLGFFTVAFIGLALTLLFMRRRRD